MLREITILRKLSQVKNNVFTTKLIDVMITDSEKDNFNEVFIVMEFADFDLRTLFEKLKPNLEKRHVITILYNLLCSMNYLHTANVIHRDLKPSNILISHDCSIKICDFGVARTLPKELTTKI